MQQAAICASPRTLDVESRLQRMQYSVFATDAPSRTDLASVDASLDAFNSENEALREVRTLCVFVRDAQGIVIGGAVGRTWGHCCELQQLAVSAVHRKVGLGTELMRKFESEARQRGCTLVYLDTFSFQAPAFYQRCGYAVAHQTEGFSHGVIKFTMQKTLGHA